MDKIYLHKYSLSSRKIEEVEGKFKGNLFRPSKSSGYEHIYFHPTDYCLTREDAIKAANERRDKKIQSLQRQIKKLETLNFNK